MNYSELIRDAWATTWRNRVLWVLGLLAGVTAASVAVGRSSWPGEDLDPVMLRQLQDVFGPLAGWASAALRQDPMVASAGVLLVLAFVVSVAARGAMLQTTLDLERGQSASLGVILRSGARWFWRVLSLLLVLMVLSSGVLGVSALAALNLGQAGAVLAAAALTAGVIASIVLAYAERATVTHDLGPLRALTYGWSLFRAHLGASLLAWIVSVGLACVVGAASAVGIGTAWMFFGLVGAIGMVVLAAAIGNALFWSYWTLAFVRLDTGVNNNGQLATA